MILQVAAAVMGSPEPMEGLLQRLTLQFSSSEEGPSVTEGLIKTTVLEVAMRKSYSAKSGADCRVNQALSLL